MTTKDEALRQALEALGHFEKAGLATLKTIDAITAIKQALEQPEPEPAIYPDEAYELGLERIAYYTAPPKREPIETQREKVAQWMIDRGYATGHGDTIEDLLKELEWQIRESEREACAKVCEQSDRYRGDYFAHKIRARGNT